jgi:flagellar biosynthesis protein FlhF
LNRLEITPAPRKFVATTSREALRLARESLGSEALVLASRALPEGVEIIAMAEEVAAALAQRVAPTGHDAAAAAAAATPAPPGDAVLSELHSMRSMIEERLGSVMWNDQQRRDPVRGRLLRTMLGAGFSARLSKAMLEHLPAGHSYAEGVAFVKSELLRTIPAQEGEDALLAKGGVYALMGPTGVGKTTTTAKLAARCVMRFGADKVALVTTDGYRIGAYEQLRIYGQILNVPVYAVKDTANLQLVLQRELRDKHMVLIDTVGMSQRDRSVSDHIAMLCSAGRPVKRLLLLNAASHGDTLNEVVYAYQRADKGNELAGCIFTKLDEAPSYGALLDTVIRHRLPVHYLCNGQKVPENLSTVDCARLVEDVLKPPAAGALFVTDPDLGQAAAGDAPVVMAPAKAEAERLRLQYRQLIQAIAHDAEEVAAAARTLQEVGVGFVGARQLWNQVVSPEIEPESMLRELLRLARSEVAASCERYALAVCGLSPLDANEDGDHIELHGSLLLSDSTGQPLAAPHQWLSTRGNAKGAERRIQWLRQQEFGKPLAHVLPKPPAAHELQRWTGQAWLARAARSTLVIDPQAGQSKPLWRIDMQFGPAEAVTHRGKNAVRAEAETEVLQQCADGSQVRLRLVSSRLSVAGSQRPLEQYFVLSNIGAEVSARQLGQWSRWAGRADACFRTTGKGLALMGGIGELGDPSMMKRVLAAGQVATTAARLLDLPGTRAARTRVLLTELAGRQVRSDRPQSPTVLYEGLVKLFHLLEAFAADSVAEGATNPGSAA